MDTLQIAQAIQDNNAGQPYLRLDLAKALNRTPSSGEFRMLITTSSKFGLTKGSYKASKIQLTERGKSIVAPRTPDEKNNALRETLLSIDLFNKFFDRFDGQKLPKQDYIQNTLERDFGVPAKDVEACYKLIIKNAKELGLLDEIKGSTYIRLNNLSIEVSQLETKAEEISEEESKDIDAITEESQLIETPPAVSIKEPALNQIFVIHGKNKKPLEQLKNILDEFKIPYNVAIDEPHRGRPISQKVSDLMHECTSAIVIFTADEKYIDENGNEIFRPSDNAVFELGAAGVLYGKKIVILKEIDVSLASDFSDLGYISFEKDMLKAKAMDLIKELIGFGFLKVTPT